VNFVEALQATRRLEELGVLVPSRELASQLQELRTFNARGGNRSMRRAAAKARRRKR
jgi:hypothetical protein